MSFQTGCRLEVQSVILLFVTVSLAEHELRVLLLTLDYQSGECTIWCQLATRLYISSRVLGIGDREWITPVCSHPDQRCGGIKTNIQE
ncbi:hypothetical protein B0T22DRAFT_455510 [Podospora appendiculata]|uniref:Uncharacterized protein n=1 Tax=Podospora appendiculata TaxID=314037 RepID=A0AAE1CIE7_9PEZI|nr:hypothetical protein B0T22DRAFT_455510 [Podospora appendiculata]